MFSCFAQDATDRSISENDFEKITFLEKVTIDDLKAHDQSWTLLKEKLGTPKRKENKDEFLEQTKIIYYEGATFQYSDAGDPGNFALTQISITESDFYITLNGKSLRVGDRIEKITQWEYSVHDSASVISLKIFETDTSGNLRRHESGEKIESESEFLSVKFDPATKEITEINFMWRII